jgi:hypothetical protein
LPVKPPFPCRNTGYRYDLDNPGYKICIYTCPDGSSFEIRIPEGWDCQKWADPYRN